MTTSTEQIPVHCSTAADRAAREAATRELMERRAASTDEDERQRLLEEVVELNIEMARGIARRFRGRGAEADDLEQVAYLGLVKAAHRVRHSDHPGRGETVLPRLRVDGPDPAPVAGDAGHDRHQAAAARAGAQP
jgi:hypothetical protein